MAHIKDVLVTIPEAVGILCPYTGRPLDVYMRISSGLVTFSAPKAMSLAVPYTDRSELLKVAGLRDGVAGPEGAETVCAYTGANLVVETTSDGRYYMRGAFNPRSAHISLPKFLSILSRNAVNLSAPLPCRTIPEIPTEVDEDQKFEIPQEAHERTEKAAEQFVRSTGIDRAVRVSMATKSRKKPKGARKCPVTR